MPLDGGLWVLRPQARHGRKFSRDFSSARVENERPAPTGGAAAANGAATTSGARTMTKVTAQMSVSLDGFYTGPRDTRGPKDMSAWMRGPEAPGFFRVTRWVVDAMAWRERQGFAGGEQSINSEIIEETVAAARGFGMGRRLS